MQFAPLDLALGSILQSMAAIQTTSPEPEVPPAEVELPDDWREFHSSLKGYKHEYIKMLKEVKDTQLKLRQLRREMNGLEDLLSLAESQSLKSRVTDILEQFQKDNDIEELTKYLSTVKGTCAAMKSVLNGTSPEDLARFQCYICSENGIDRCFDPCGHSMCDSCWSRVGNMQTPRCPACREPVRKALKIFTI
jgi:hypothetical protein